MGEFRLGNVAVGAVVGVLPLIAIAAIWPGDPPTLAVVAALLVAAEWQTT
ncbi:hypothetical protein [Rhodococcus wratislaviensis]|nr:hypothetical protein [Rhodococcus wratislaviensis]